LGGFADAGGETVLIRVKENCGTASNLFFGQEVDHMDPLIAISGVAAIAVLFVLVPVAIDGYFAYRQARTVECPTVSAEAEIVIPAWRGVASPFGMMIGRAPITACSLWPGHAGCDQRCLRNSAKVAQA
jgi:hypothetical protein